MSIERKETKKKYRPVLSATAIAHIIALAKSEHPLSSRSIEVIATLSPFLAKIENAGVAPAYTEKPVLSLEEKLGMPVPLHSVSKEQLANQTKEVYWNVCYNKYKINPVSCSLVEIEAAREHMYLHDLMSPQEIEEFEATHHK